MEIAWPKGWFDSLLSENDKLDEKRTGVKAQRILNGIEAQTIVTNAGGPFWKMVLQWGQEHELLSSTESGILTASASLPNRLPSEKQCIRTLEILRKLHTDGYQQGLQLFT